MTLSAGTTDLYFVPQYEITYSAWNDVLYISFTNRSADAHLSLPDGLKAEALVTRNNDTLPGILGQAAAGQDGMSCGEAKCLARSATLSAIMPA